MQMKKKKQKNKKKKTKNSIGCPHFKLLELSLILFTTTNIFYYSFNQDPSNIDDKDDMNNNLQHHGVVDVDCKILNDPL